MLILPLHDANPVLLSAFNLRALERYQSVRYCDLVALTEQQLIITIERPIKRKQDIGGDVNF